MTDKTLTHQHLIAAGIPSWDIARFRAVFPNGTAITADAIQIASKHGLTASVLLSATATPQQYTAWNNNRVPWNHRQSEIEAMKKQLRSLEDAIKQDRDRIERERLADALNEAIFGAKT